MNKNTLFIVIMSLVITLGISACSLSLAQDVTPPPGYRPPVYEEPVLLVGAFPEQEPDLENGAAIYQEKCLPCHGATGLGDGPESSGLPVEVAPIGTASIADLSSPLEWYTIVLQGNIDRFMPPFSNSLSGEDVWDVVSYVYSFSADQELAAEGAALYLETCAECHGAEGTGPVAPGAFDFRDDEQMVLFSLDDYVQKIATGNGNPDHVFANVLDADQQKAIAAYLRSLVLPLGVQPVEVAAEEPAPSPTEESVVDQPDDAEESPTEPAAEDTQETPDHNFIQVTGVVENGSGGNLPESLDVTLEVYQSFELLYTDTVTAEGDGSFVFEDVILDPELIYIAVVELDGTFYPSTFHMGNEIEGESIDLPITIYDKTSDPSTLSVSRLHVFFQFGEETVQVIHQVSVSNLGDLLVAPVRDTEPVLNFSLPEDATNLIFETGTLGNPYVKTAAGFGDPSPVLPGNSTYDVLFAYEMPFDGKVNWVLPIDLPTDVGVFFVQGDEMQVESETLMPSGTEALDQEVYQVFVANTLSSGQEIDMTISSGFGGLGSLKLDGGLVTIILGVVGLALAGFGAWRFFRPEDDFEEEEFDHDVYVDELMDEIVDLDEAFVAGEIDEAPYRKRRESIKEELKRLLDQEEAE